MTKITIHGQKMQYHKRVAISVSLVQTIGGTIAYVPTTGYPGINRLPIGAQIAEVNGDYHIIHNNVTIGAVSISADQYYDFSDLKLSRAGETPQRVTTTPITLQDGDSLAANWEAWVTVTLNNGAGAFTDISGDNISSIKVPNTKIRFTGEGLNKTPGAIEYYYSNSWVLCANYYLYDQGDMIEGYNGYGPVIDFVPGPTSKVFPDEWGLPMGYLGTAIFTIVPGTPPVTCALVDYQTAGLPSPYALDGAIETAVRNTIPDIQQMQQRMMPNQFNYILMDQDGIYGFCKYSCTYRTVDQRGNTQYVNSQVYVAFYQHSSSLIAMPYECVQASQYQIMPLWSETHLPTPDNYINPVFDNGDEYGLNNWMADWNCRSICDFTDLIKDLAEYNI